MEQIRCERQRIECCCIEQVFYVWIEGKAAERFAFEPYVIPRLALIVAYPDSSRIACSCNKIFIERINSDFLAVKSRCPVSKEVRFGGNEFPCHSFIGGFMNSRDHFMAAGFTRSAKQYIGMRHAHSKRFDIMMISFRHSIIDRLPMFTPIDALKNSRNICSNIYNIGIIRMLQYSGNVPAAAKFRTRPPVFDFRGVWIFGCK